MITQESPKEILEDSQLIQNSQLLSVQESDSLSINSSISLKSIKYLHPNLRADIPVNRPVIKREVVPIRKSGLRLLLNL